MLPFAFTPTDLRWHGNKIDDIGKVIGNGRPNAANQIFFRSTPVAMATKFGAKLAISRLA